MSTSTTSDQWWVARSPWVGEASEILEEQALEDAHPLKISDLLPRWPHALYWMDDASTILNEQAVEEESQKI